MAKNGKLIWVLHYNSKNPQSNHFCHLWAKNYQLASDLQSFERKKKSMVGGINFLKISLLISICFATHWIVAAILLLCKFLEKCKYLDLQTSLTSSFFPTRKLFGKKKMTIEILHVFKHILILKSYYWYCQE